MRKENIYFERGESVMILEKLLLAQYGDEEEVQGFLQRCYNVCDKRQPKKNSMFILGPPNSGKTFFLETLSCFYMNPGHVKNFVRGSAFPLQDAVNRRILIWNEPSIVPSQFDSVKMLTAGDPMPCDVKYQSGAVITRTPLFFTSNAQIFDSGDPVWSSRIYFEEWKTCPELKEYAKYPYPLSWHDLLIKYNIISYFFCVVTLPQLILVEMNS